MKLLTALVPCDDKLLTMDALLIEGTVWLVPQWLENLEEGWRTPARTIRVPMEHLQNLGDDFPHDVLAGQTLSIDVLSGRSTISPLGERCEVIELPGYRIPLRRAALS